MKTKALRGLAPGELEPAVVSRCYKIFPKRACARGTAHTAPNIARAGKKGKKDRNGGLSLSPLDRALSVTGTI